MADETVDTRFLGRQVRQILDELRDMRAEMEVVRIDNRRLLGELGSNRVSMAGISTEMTGIRGDVGSMRMTMEAILTELREMRTQNALFDNRLRRILEDQPPGEKE